MHQSINQSLNQYNYRCMKGVHNFSDRLYLSLLGFAYDSIHIWTKYSPQRYYCTTDLEETVRILAKYPINTKLIYPRFSEVRVARPFCFLCSIL